MRRTVKALTVCSVAVLCLALGLVAAALLVAASADRFRPEIESLLSKSVGRPASVGHIEVAWRGISPVLSLHDVALHEATTGAPNASFAHAQVTLDPIGSLKARQVVLTKLRIHEAVLELERAEDGRITLVGMSEGASKSASTSAGEPTAPQLLLLPHALELRDAKVRWREAGQSTSKVVFSNVDIDLGPAFDDVREIHARLAFGTDEEPHRRQNVQCQMTLRGDITHSDWSALINAEATEIDLGLAHKLALAAQREPITGLGSINLTAKVEEGRLVSGQSLFDVLLERPSPLRTQGDASFVRQPKGWRIDVTDGVLSDDTRKVALPELNVDVRLTDDRKGARYRIEKSRLPLRELAHFVDLNPNLARWRSSLSPRAELTQLELSMHDALGWRLSGRTTALGMATPRTAVQNDANPARHFDEAYPRMTGIAGSFTVTPNDMSASLQAEEGAAVIFSASQRLSVQSLRAEVAYRRSGDGWGLGVDVTNLTVDSVSANATASLRQSPAAGLRLNFRAGMARVPLDWLNSHLYAQWPDDDFVEWLKSALPKGELSDVEVVYDGAASEALSLGDGFRASTQFSTPALQFDNEWPKVRKASGSLTLVGKRFDGRIERGESLGTRIKTVSIAIPNVLASAAVLRVRSTLNTRTEAARRYVAASPMESDIGALLDELNLSGPASLSLRVTTPLPGKPQDTRINGTLRLRDNSAFATDPILALDKLSGAVTFDNDHASAESLKAIFMGSPIKIGLAPDGDATVVSLAGAADAPMLQRLLRALEVSASSVGFVPRKHLQGRTQWAAQVVVPANNVPTRLDVRSDLRGMALRLPPPLDKLAESERPFVLSVPLTGTERRIEAQLGSNLAGLFALHTDGSSWRLDGGLVSLGPDAAPEATAAIGKTFQVRGQYPLLSFDDWAQYLSDIGEGEPSGQRSPLPIDIDLKIDALLALGSTLSVDRFRARNSASALSITLSGRDAKGSLSIPAATDARVVAQFERLYLSPTKGQQSEPSTDPRRLPPVDAKVSDFRYDQMSLGRLSLKTVPSARGLRVLNGALITPSSEIQGVGEWTVTPSGRGKSEFEVAIRADDLGELLARFELQRDALSGGVTEMRLNANWPAAPAAFSLTALSGRLSISVKEGRLLTVDRGLTQRAFGLLSIQALPRHLFLDFTDAFSKGFPYDSLSGTFTISDGTAMTTDLLMEGASARIEVKGRTGLVARDYAQTVTVIPKLTSSIPLAPLWLAEQVLQTQVINRAFSTTYRLTGPWDAPNFVKVNQEPQPSEGASQ
ncbi:MAG: TIGR02099 family protein [Gammaproteobacteria bacterium]|nr:TIGR02099 family protein [Gammaproteobacteria bacterium]